MSKKELIKKKKKTGFVSNLYAVDDRLREKKKKGERGHR